MAAQRKVYESIPNIVALPEKLVHKKVGIPFILGENSSQMVKKKRG